MPQPLEDLEARLRALTQPGARDAVVRRGLARGLIWRDGRLPEGAPEFAESLTADLLDHGYLVLGQALRLRERSSSSAEVEHGLRIAAESIESAVRRGEPTADRDFHLVVAACAFHLSHFGARSFCLVPSLETNPNLSTPERALVGLMRRELVGLRAMCARWLRDDRHTDLFLARRLQDEGEEALDDVERIAITANFVRSLATLISALDRGASDLAGAAIRGFMEGSEAASATRHVPLWWANTLALHLADGLWTNSLHARIPPEIDGPSAPRWRSLRRRYIDVLRGRGTAEVDLWPSQWEAAARCVDPADDLVVALPTSAGKTRVAELCILRALADERRVVYVRPLRALSAQLERTLGRTFRPLGHTVTALYGASGIAAADVATLRDADIVVATPEKLDFALRVDSTVLDNVGLVVLDEGHMIGLGAREIRYEVLVQRLLRRPDSANRRIVCLSAIFGPGGSDLGDRVEIVEGNAGATGAASQEATDDRGGGGFADFTKWIRSDAPGRPVTSSWRPTRQRSGVLRWGGTGARLLLTVDEEQPYVPRFVRAEPPQGQRSNPFPQNDGEFVLAAAKAFLADDHRVLIYCPQRRSVESLGKTFLTIARQGHFPIPAPDAPAIARALSIGREWLGQGHVALRALERGVALHHGALPRPFLSEVENLLQRRVIRVVIASPTLAQGIDLSCSVLLFRSLYRVGNQTISPEEFANVVGRAGRAHVDLDGVTVLPIFEQGRQGSRRESEFQRLIANSAARRLESGLVMLVEQLIVHLGAALGAPPGAGVEVLRNYVLDVGSAWDLTAYATDPLGNPTDLELVAPALAELDAAILASVEDLECTVESLADALDTALRASLWARRLQTRTEAQATLARNVLVGRARWLWARTNPSTRRAYHAAGLGFTAGQFLDTQRDTLSALLLKAEGALLLGMPADAAQALVDFARLVRGVPPFSFEDAPEGWEQALTAWVTGAPVGAPPLSGDASSIVAFIQQDVVYRLVWASEAVRLHAVHTGAADAELLTGAVGAALTYGLPTVPGVVLAQAGLSSRAMVQRLVTEFPAGLARSDDVADWIAAHRATIETPGYWADADTAALWQSFVHRWIDRAPGQWQDRQTTVGVEWWSPDLIPAAEVPVALVHDDADDVTHVCAADLTPLGRLGTPLSVDQRAAVTGVVNSDRSTVTITSFQKT
jgi:hypothetical protein